MKRCQIDGGRHIRNQSDSYLKNWKTFQRKKEILKEECYVFDFAPDRALRQIADYSCRLNMNESNPEKSSAIIEPDIVNTN